MNNPAQGGQPAQGQPAGAGQQQRRPQQPLFRPDQMRNLPPHFAADKVKWEQGLRALWDTCEKNAPDTPQHQEAKRKILEFSKTLTLRMQAYRQQQQQAAAQAGQQGQGQAGQQNQQPQQSQQPQQNAQNQQNQQSAAARPPSQGQPQQAQGGEASSGNAEAEQQRKPGANIPPKVMEHVSKFPYVLPPQLTAGTPEAAKWLQDAKQRYLKGLIAMENATNRLAQLDNMQKQWAEEGKQRTPEEEKSIKEKRDICAKAHADAKNFVDSFRNQQRQAAQNQQQSAGGVTGGNSSAAQNPQAPTRPQLNPQQASNPALQSTQTVNAAIEAARNQQMNGPRPSIPQNNPVSQPNQMPPQNAPAMPTQGSQPNIKQEAGPPPQINTAITQMQGQNRPMQNSPQSALPPSATSQAPPQVPRALTHSAALSQAARSYSNGGNGGQSSAPQVMGHSHPSVPRDAQNVMTNKMPIPKHLPERAIAPPQPVAVNQSRPTYSGGPSMVGNGVMAQPVLPKTPGYNMAGDGDRVLSRKKLDELVKQVTGGGHGDGPSLTPEVEESMLTVADTFVDQVLHAACKVSKERGSKQLEIRDIQLTLERGYNIRIPGYASDEIRTVRKIQPSSQWIAKMSAVQAAKVTGGKTTD